MLLLLLLVQDSLHHLLVAEALGLTFTYERDGGSVDHWNLLAGVVVDKVGVGGCGTAHATLLRR